MNPFERKSPGTVLWVCISLACGSYLSLGSRSLPQVYAQMHQAPLGWIVAGSNPEDYRTGVDKLVNLDGRPSAYLVSAMTEVNGFGTLMQSVDAEKYAGKRVRLRASVKSQTVLGWAGMWMRVDKGRTMVAFDNMQNRAITGTQAWSTRDVVLDVPEDATAISFGILLSGAGQVWVNHVTLETAGKETETTGSKSQKSPLSKAPVNLDFSE